MRTQTLERPTESPSAERSEYERYYNGLAVAAQAIIDNPRQRKILNYYLDDDGDAIHKRKGGELRDGDTEYAQHHGTFVAPNGAIYRLRGADWQLQVYTSPVDERGDSIDCIRPYTYDGYMGPYDIEMRVDFINGAGRAVPANNAWDRELQRREYGNAAVSIPRHQEGMDFPAGRDSIALRKHRDGHVEGWLHDSVSGDVVTLYSPAEVQAMIGILDEESARID